MEELLEESMTIFAQGEVWLKKASSFYIQYINNCGQLYITEYLNSNKARFIEWKPNDVTIDSDNQEQEWAVVSTSKECKSKFIKISLSDLKSFKVSKKCDNLTLIDGRGETICNFQFKQGTCNGFVSSLKGLLKTAVTTRDKSTHIVVDDIDEARRLDKSFAELDLFPDSRSQHYIWGFVKDLHKKPLETTLEAFSKITDIVVASPERRDIDEDTADILHRSITALESSPTAKSQGDYEVVSHSKLPKRRDYPRGAPLTSEQWRNLQNGDGKVEDVDYTKLHIFRGGVDPALRSEIWKYLLNYYPWGSTHTQRLALQKVKEKEYYAMKLQWISMTAVQKENFSDFRERKSLIEKDVMRTDRTLDFYSGDNNQNLQTLYEILMTYVMYNFDLGYVQGMSDLLSPILNLLNNEVEAFWCFVGFMNRVSTNFDMDQAGMKEQLENLHTLLSFVNPSLASYLDKHDSGNMFFCFRWLLVWYKRELSQEDVMSLWEVLWTGLPCDNFHLLISIAILESQKDTLTENSFGFTEILKHINDLSGHLDVKMIINNAEGIFNQIKSAIHLTDAIRIILGLPIVEFSPKDSSSSIERIDSENTPDNTFDSNLECSYEASINTTYH